MEDDFPNTTVVNEYLNPHVENITQPFKFEKPDVVTLEKILTGKFKMREQETKAVLDTISKVYKEYSQNRQTKIKEYMTRSNDGPCAVIQSKRLMKAVTKASEQ